MAGLTITLYRLCCAVERVHELAMTFERKAAGHLKPARQAFVRLLHQRSPCDKPYRNRAVRMIQNMLLPLERSALDDGRPLALYRVRTAVSHAIAQGLQPRHTQVKAVRSRTRRDAVQVLLHVSYSGCAQWRGYG